MLRELRIENLLLIERAELRLGAGLNAITGETGAGKTILAHSLDLLMGGKARPQIVRPGAEEAWVEGSFDLPEGLLDEPEMAELAARLPGGVEEVVLGRRVSAAGRTAAFVAGRAATAADLKLLGGRLLAFYGQHEHRKLTIASAQAEVLDGFAGPEHLALLDRYREAYRETLRLEAELAELREPRRQSRARPRPLPLRALGDRGGRAGPRRGSRSWSRSESGYATPRASARRPPARRKARPAPAMGTKPGRPGRSPPPGSLLDAVGGVDPKLDALAARLAALTVELSDVASELRAYLDGDRLRPRAPRCGRGAAGRDRPPHPQARRRGRVGACPRRALPGRDRAPRVPPRSAPPRSRRPLAKATGRRAKLAKGLSRGRADAAAGLGGRVATELDRLAMAGATLEVVLEAHPEGYGPNGTEAIELRLAPNPGIEAAPLRDAASGGELSRVMLALTGLGAGAGAGTLVFDEIDAGIGGRTARTVGERLRDIAAGRQVICITHLPQVASLASTHFRLEKDRGEPARATVQLLDGESVVEEIGRMLGGARRRWRCRRSPRARAPRRRLERRR